VQADKVAAEARAEDAVEALETAHRDAAAAATEAAAAHAAALARFTAEQVRIEASGSISWR